MDRYRIDFLTGELRAEDDVLARDAAARAAQAKPAGSTLYVMLGIGAVLLFTLRKEIFGKSTRRR